MRKIIQLNSGNVIKFLLFNMWLGTKIIVILLSISILKVLTIRLCIYNLSKINKKIDAKTTKRKDFKNIFFRKNSGVSLSDKWAGNFFEGDSSGGLWTIGEAEWNSIGGRYEGKWGGGTSCGFGESLNEIEEDIWGDEDWGNGTCEVSLWTIDLRERCTM